MTKHWLLSKLFKRYKTNQQASFAQDLRSRLFKSYDWIEELTLEFKNNKLIVYNVTFNEGSTYFLNKQLESIAYMLMSDSLRTNKKFENQVIYYNREIIKKIDRAYTIEFSKLVKEKLEKTAFVTSFEYPVIHQNKISFKLNEKDMSYINFDTYHAARADYNLSEMHQAILFELGIKEKEFKQLILDLYEIHHSKYKKYLYIELALAYLLEHPIIFKK